MKKSFKINIAEPCHEDWSVMSPTQKGKFCDACAKEVIDFTHKSDEQLYKLVQNGHKICGRFNTSQLNRDIQLQRKEKNSIATYAASLLLPISILATQDVKAQGEPIVQTEQTDRSFKSLGISSLSRKAKPQTPETTFEIKGVVYDEDQYPLPGATIIVKGTTQGVQADFDGNFTLEVQAGDILEISYVGFERKEIIVASRVKEYKIVLGYSSVLGGITLGMIAVSDPDPKPLLTSISNPHDTDFEETEEQRMRREERREHRKKVEAWEKVKDERAKKARKALRKKKKRS